MADEAVDGGAPPTVPGLPGTVGGQGPAPGWANQVDATNIFQTALKQSQALAAGQVADQIAPLNANVSSDQRMELAAHNAIQSEFGSILPTVTTNANELDKFNQLAQGASQQIYQQASNQLSSIAQNQAAQAQRVAQQSGGPVSTGSFTASTDPYQQAEVASGSVDQLTTLNLGAGASAAAHAFAGEVFPAMETEQLASNRAKYQNDIKTLKDQINQIGATKSKLAAAALPGLLKSQQDYKLTQKQMQLKALQDTRNFKLAMTAQDQKQQELDLLTQKEIDSQWYKTQQVKQGNKKIVQAGTKITNTKVAAATTATERARHDRAVEANYTVGQNIARRRVAATENANVYHLIDAALGGSTSTSPVKIQRKQYLDPSNPLVVAAKAYSGVPSLLGKSAPKNIFHDKQGWYTFNTTTVTPQQFAIESGSSGTPVTKAQDLWDVISNAMPSEAKTPNGRKLILGVINSRLGISGWTPGKTSVAATNAVTTPTVGGAPSGPAAPATATYLAKLPLSSLTDVAMKLGFPGSPKAVSRQHLVDFILAHQGKYNAAAA